MFDRSVLLCLRSAAQALECDKSLAQRDRIAQATEKLHGCTDVLEITHRSHRALLMLLLSS
jgi:hypothetical protein